jgi:hypothetical protein
MGDSGTAPADASAQTDAPSFADSATTIDAPTDGPISACSRLTDAGSRPQLCTGVNTLVLSQPTVEGLDGGAASRGNAALVLVLLSDPPNGAVVDDYPQVCFATDTADVWIDPAGNPAWGLYAIKPGVSAWYAVDVRFGASLAPGTVVHFVAQPTAAGYCTNGASLQWDVTLP